MDWRFLTEGYINTLFEFGGNMFFDQQNAAKYSLSSITTESAEYAWKSSFSIRLARQDVFTSITVAELQNLYSFSFGRGLVVTLNALPNGKDVSIELTFEHKHASTIFNLKGIEKKLQEQIQKQAPSDDAALLNIICETANEYSCETEYGEKKEMLLNQLRAALSTSPFIVSTKAFSMIADAQVS